MSQENMKDSIFVKPKVWPSSTVLRAKVLFNVGNDGDKTQALQDENSNIHVLLFSGDQSAKRGDKGTLTLRCHEDGRQYFQFQKDACTVSEAGENE